LFKTGSAKASADATLVTGSTAAYGVLASPGVGAVQPIQPTLGTTTHGVIGSNSAVTVVPFGSGVAGVRNGANLAGVLGANGGDGLGVFGVSESGAGVKGESTSGTGVSGASDTSFGGVFRTAQPNKPALVAESTAASTKFAGLFKGKLRVQGDFQVTGAKAAAVKLPDGSLVTMYCQESPQPFFEDFGRGQLVGGVAKVSLEPEFASLIHLEDYMVFLTAEGDSNGLFVSKRDAQAFEVRELKGGTGSLAFTYRLVAKRKDIPGERLARLDPVDEGDVAEEAWSKPPTARQYAGSDDAVVPNG
jgi:hypothetical protein